MLLKINVASAASSLRSWLFQLEVRAVEWSETSQCPWAALCISKEHKIPPPLLFSNILTVPFCIQHVARLYMLTPSFSSKLLNNSAHPAGKRAAATPALSFFIILIASAANYLNTEVPPSRVTKRCQVPVSPSAVAGDLCFICTNMCVSAHASSSRIYYKWELKCSPLLSLPPSISPPLLFLILCSVALR